ncbi:hypothetical protein Tco_1292878 [Tanacetum coccineum]|uniref:DUF4283 domain-containing protein n=1 Tax=Tanacetum coccineum TaxID=301880 RepID=A0ABQ5ICB9_9ASTR
METSKNSYAYVLKDGNQSDNSKPSLVLDESCIKEHDFDISLIGKLSYLGEMWVLLELDSIASKEKFLNHIGVGSWFTTMKQVTNSVVCDERIVWVSIEGLPIKAWTPDSFRKMHHCEGSLWSGKTRIQNLCHKTCKDDLSSDEESKMML